MPYCWCYNEQYSIYICSCSKCKYYDYRVDWQILFFQIFSKSCKIWSCMFFIDLQSMFVFKLCLNIWDGGILFVNHFLVVFKMFEWMDFLYFCHSFLSMSLVKNKETCDIQYQLYKPGLWWGKIVLSSWWNPASNLLKWQYHKFIIYVAFQLLEGMLTAREIDKWILTFLWDLRFEFCWQ